MSLLNLGTVRPEFKLILTACCILYVAHGQSSFLWVKKKYLFLKLHLFICLVVCLCDVGLRVHTWLRVCDCRGQLGGWFYTSLWRSWRLNSVCSQANYLSVPFSAFPLFGPPLVSVLVKERITVFHPQVLKSSPLHWHCHLLFLAVALFVS